MKRPGEAVRRKRPDLWWGEKLVAPSWWRSGAFVSSDSWFSHKKWDEACPPGSVHTRLCTSRLLSLHHAEIHTERMTIWVCRGDYRKFFGRTMQYFKSAIPGMLPKVEEMLRVM
jgi:hypothetical protein